MRISDWSSDVCSSDLLAVGRRFELIEARYLRARRIDGDGERDDAQHRENTQDLEREDQPAAPRAPGRLSFGGGRTGHEVVWRDSVLTCAEQAPRWGAL